MTKSTKSTLDPGNPGAKEPNSLAPRPKPRAPLNTPAEKRGRIRNVHPWPLLSHAEVEQKKFDLRREPICLI